jgi:hypothetical protein
VKCARGQRYLPSSSLPSSPSASASSSCAEVTTRFYCMISAPGYTPGKWAEASMSSGSEHANSSASQKSSVGRSGGPGSSNSDSNGSGGSVGHRISGGSAEGATERLFSHMTTHSSPGEGDDNGNGNDHARKTGRVRYRYRYRNVEHPTVSNMRGTAPGE